MHLRVSLFFSLLLAVHAAPAYAQCDCDHVIELDMSVVTGTDLGAAPGDRVCVMAGEREFLRLQGFMGSADAPIQFINCGGLVDIYNTDRAYGLVVEDGSRYFHITGTGDPAYEYGFKIRTPDKDPWPGVGLTLIGKVSDYEVDHIEISDTGFAGVSAKTDPLCDGSADEGVFTQYNTHIHHLYVHDTGGEGFYIGSTQSNGHTITCEGQQEVHMPHFLEGVDVHDNILENTGWDGAQVGMARSGCRVYRNVIRNVGLEGIQYQQQGLQIGTWSTCEVWGNVIEQGPANGIIILEAGDTSVVNNHIRGFASHGVYANDRDRVAGARYQFLFNSIADYGENAITIFGSATAGSRAHNNLLIGAEPGVAAGNEVDWTESHNLVFADAAAAGLVGPNDLQLTADSPAVGAGLAMDEVTVDLRGVRRGDPPAVGAYEYIDPSAEDIAQEDVWTPADLGSPTDTASPPGGDTAVPTNKGEDGCGCALRSPHASQGAGWLLLLGVFALVGAASSRHGSGGGKP